MAQGNELIDLVASTPAAPAESEGDALPSNRVSEDLAAP